MADALIWFLLLELTAVVALPWAFFLFPFLPDRGLTLLKPAALLFFSYALWVLGLTHVWPITQLTAWAIFLTVAAGSYWLFRTRWEELRDFLRSNWPVLLAAELIFVALFALWAYVVSGAPAITHTEKPMDFMLLNAAHQTRYFPAEDLWLSGHSISYYYFGHVIIAFLTGLTGAVSSTAYNLGVATIPALAGAVAFGLVYNLVRLAGGGLRPALAVGAAAPALILLAGNLVGALEFVRIRGWAGEGFWDWAAIKGLDAPSAVGGVFPPDFWWWFRSTRVIDTLAPDGASLDYTITEFPAFSFILGDLHAHVLAIPLPAVGNLRHPQRLPFARAAGLVLAAPAPGPGRGSRSVRRGPRLHKLLGLPDFPGPAGRRTATQRLPRLPQLPAPSRRIRRCGICAVVGLGPGNVHALLSRRIQRPDLGNTALAGRSYPPLPAVCSIGPVHPSLPGLPGKDSAADSSPRPFGRLRAGRQHASGGHRPGVGRPPPRPMDSNGFHVRHSYQRSRSCAGRLGPPPDPGRAGRRHRRRRRLLRPDPSSPRKSTVPALHPSADGPGLLPAAGSRAVPHRGLFRRRLAANEHRVQVLLPSLAPARHYGLFRPV